MATTDPALIKLLKEIAQGLKDPDPEPLEAKNLLEVDATVFDYVRIQELMGRRGGPNDPDNSRVFAASRTAKGSGSIYSTVTVFDSPADAVKLAVFTARGNPAETFDVNTGAAAAPRGFSRALEFDLTKVTNDQPIIRVELLGTEGYAIRLGPRLAVV